METERPDTPPKPRSAGDPVAVASRAPRAESRPRMTPLTGTSPRAAGLAARERLERYGVNTLSDAGLLTILAGSNAAGPPTRCPTSSGRCRPCPRRAPATSCASPA